MNLILLLLLLQDRPIESSVEAFLKGDKSARAELVKAGAYAILPLKKARDKAPGKIDPLILELKKAAAYPTPRDFEGDFSGSVSIEGEKPVEIGLFGGELLQSKRLPIFLDRFDPTKLKSATVTVTDVTSRLHFAQEVCRQTGLDYGWFHNHIVIGLPERLWPSEPPPKWGELTADERKKAKSLVEALDDRVVEKAVQAEGELLKMGPRVIPILDSQLRRKEQDIVDRCHGLLLRLRPRAGRFGPSAAMRQNLDEAGQGVMRLASKSMPGHFWFQNRALSGVADFLKKDYSLTLDIRGDHSDRKISISHSGKVIDFLSLMTQCLDLDFAIQGRAIVIDEREAVEKLISEVK